MRLSSRELATPVSDYEGGDKVCFKEKTIISSCNSFPESVFEQAGRRIWKNDIGKYKFLKQREDCLFRRFKARSSGKDST
ncbi:hypothetical protein TNCV_2054081 [Trichonephila clavipes]|nr:hypothetical protein TNCV_2054081 [Trichonephila clavipes]